jgi:NAD(P)-dependent dehydrogenase (short-subunit alcohol dehydrogenase family)
MNNAALNLNGKVAIVTGAGGGLGRGIALALAAAGAKVAIAARRKVTGDETAALIHAEGGQALSIEADVSRRADVDRTIAETIDRFGALHIAVHNASSGLSSVGVKVTDISDENWREQTRIAIDCPFYLARAALPHLKNDRHGRFIILSSSQGATGGSMNPAYAAVKSGQRGFIRALAREWGPFGIAVNGVMPAGLSEAAKGHFERHPELREAIYKQIPMGRLGDPRLDIGGAIVALASESNGYVTGQTIAVDGGIITQ